MQMHVDASFLAQRRAAISESQSVFGIDYIAARLSTKRSRAGSQSQSLTLSIHFVPPAAGMAKSKRTLYDANLNKLLNEVNAQNIQIHLANGSAQERIRVGGTSVATAGGMRQLAVECEFSAGSTVAQVYTLTIENVSTLDPFFNHANFTLFKEPQAPVDSDPVEASHSAYAPSPTINYLSKDFGSFRQLIKDRLAQTMPNWQEEHPADLGNVLVDLLAYVGDNLSYYQDAVATEAYLGTARRRVSISRHARLVDYRLHEGCNARAWFQIQVNRAITIPQGARLLTQIPSLAITVLDEGAFQEGVQAGATIYETMHPQKCHPAGNQLHFYTWGAARLTIPQGSTGATLVAHGKSATSLAVGDVLIFEELPSLDQVTNPHHRHAVRLTYVNKDTDALTQVQIIHIRWHHDDALPFDMHLTRVESAAGKLASGWVALGNIVLADHGLTVGNNAAEASAGLPSGNVNQPDALVPAIVPHGPHYHPRLQLSDVTYAVPYDHQVAQSEPANNGLHQEPHHAMAAVTNLVSQPGGVMWQVTGDLFDCDRFATAFVVEMESDRSAYLRFGDGENGRPPEPGTLFSATYRVGNGTAGRIGQDTMAHLYCPQMALHKEKEKEKEKGKEEEKEKDGTGIHLIRNPLSSVGGLPPESLEQVRLNAPQSFYTNERCVIEEDYVAMALQHPEVAQARATIRWTGSWYTAFVIVERVGDKAVDLAFQQTIEAYLAPYRVMGYEIAIRPPAHVPLRMAFTLTLTPNQIRSTVDRGLSQRFSSQQNKDGQKGYFHPDNLHMGEPIYLSHIVAAIAQIEGIANIDPTQFQRWGEPAQNELANGIIPIAPLAVAQVGNDPHAPELGQISFTLVGGR